MSSTRATVIGIVKAPARSTDTGQKARPLTVLAADGLACEGDFCSLPEPDSRASAVNGPESAD